MVDRVFLRFTDENHERSSRSSDICWAVNLELKLLGSTASVLFKIITNIITIRIWFNSVKL